MKRSRTRRAAVIYVLLQVVAAALALLLSKQFQVARMAATLVALAPTVPAAYLAWAAYRDDRREAAADTDAKAAMLAKAVAAAETGQRAQLIGPGAHRIDLNFTRRTEPANNATGADPHGRLTDIVGYYQSLHPARLVITGEPGAGKTLLALELLLGLLTRPDRNQADPVPIRLSLADWHTDRPLTDWLTDQVHQQFRDRGLTAADAAVLVEQHRVLPVLDGLDEMDTDATPAGRRRAVRALQQLNAYQDPTGSAPVILTCRTTQYEQLAALDVRMREAARVEITPVTPAQADAYLTARSTRPDRWRPVLDTLTTAPGGSLAQALGTPWRLNLAVTAYEERHADTLAYLRDPSDLLTLASSDAVRDHLLALYLPAATSQHPTRPDGYRPDQTHRWLAALAAHLASTPAAAGSGTDLVLHRLWQMAGSRRVRTTDAFLTTLLAFGFGALFLAQFPIGFSPRQLRGAAGVVLLALWAVWQASRPAVSDPATFQIHRLRTSAGRRQVAPWLMVGLVFGLVIGLVFGPAVGLVYGITVGLAAGLTIGLTLGLTVGLTAGLTASLSEIPPTDPRYAIRDDLVAGLVCGLVAGLVYGFTIGPAVGLVFGITTGLMCGLTAALYISARAGRRYLAFLCCSRGRLPWRLGAFLHWAYGAGLLRISGVAYQFRHRELQDWLATHPGP
ncbi:hypothetical protein AAW14_11945 [Streptomyces hygroscopicus]|uniref:NACHT domain-containing protein n=1 Tax=Streptomyces hygroscopicus TaxID=1912 RepID=UPI00223F3155|nr:NACHT domain-containing protein [Streptomyces hygroscopicus]MCW7942729.1 hypothetical protein [Streptomyces hygroscopicus]